MRSDPVSSLDEISGWPTTINHSYEQVEGKVLVTYVATCKDISVRFDEPGLVGKASLMRTDKLNWGGLRRLLYGNPKREEIFNIEIQENTYLLYGLDGRGIPASSFNTSGYKAALQKEAEKQGIILLPKLLRSAFAQIDEALVHFYEKFINIPREG